MPVSTRRFGRCGNSLFMYATMIGYAKRHGLEYHFPQQTNDEIWNPLYFTDLLLPEWKEGHEDILINEVWNAEQQYQDIPYHENWKGKQIVLNGYWQTEKYFIDYREKVLKTFNLHWELKEGWVSLHRRYGDYVKYADIHHNITDDYIRMAIDYFVEKGFNNFLVFSDDIPQVKATVNQHIYPQANFEYSEGKTEMEDMVLGSCCQHNIIAASSFSWWQSWLGQNEDKIVIAPVKWFEEKNKHLTTKDLIPDRWIKM